MVPATSDEEEGVSVLGAEAEETDGAETSAGSETRTNALLELQTVKMGVLVSACATSLGPSVRD